MADNTGGRRIIEVREGILGPATPRARSVRPKNRGDFPQLPQAYFEVVRKLSSPLLMGPPVCDELVAFVQHLFTEEEAAVVRHLGPFSGTSAAHIARAEHRPIDEIEPILHGLSVVKRAIVASGAEGAKKYRLMPIMPGIFEMVLIGVSPESMSPWHRRFAELFEALYETGYAADYQQGQTRPSPAVRVLAIGRAIEAHPMALPSDYLEVVLDRYEVFGVGQCQCRMTMQVAGQGCGKPLSNCTVMGQWAGQGIQQGWLREVSRKGLLDIKREAESHGLVTWIMNAESAKGQASCSCCGCCCHAMRMVNEFNAPGVMAPAHFQPRFDDAKCTLCGKCAKHCPMGAILIDTRREQAADASCRQPTPRLGARPASQPRSAWSPSGPGALPESDLASPRRHLAPRCIGCGLCAVACGDRGAIAMEPVPDYKLPYKSWFSYQFHAAARMLKGAWTVWKTR